MYSLDEIMDSRNIAVIGASRDPLKPGAMLLKVLRDTGFQGQVAGVNPQGGHIHGIPLYRSLKEIPFSIELAVLLISPEAVKLSRRRTCRIKRLSSCSSDLSATIRSLIQRVNRREGLSFPHPVF